MPFNSRRVVTGLDEQGRSCVISDGVPKQVVEPESIGTSLAFLWKTDTAPADNSGNEDAAAQPFTYKVAHGGSAFILVRMPGKKEFASMSEEARLKLMTDELPENMRDSTKNAKPGMHATPTVDYLIILEGQVTLILEAEEVELKAGDILIDRGAVHAWENRGEDACVMATIMIDAIPMEGAH